jgi:hypothetical protein
LRARALERREGREDPGLQDAVHSGELWTRAITRQLGRNIQAKKC